MKTRHKRQIDIENDDIGSTTEKLLVDPPEGWGLAHVLGMGIKWKYHIFLMYHIYFRNNISDMPCNIHHWHYIQTHQNAPWNLC